MPQNPFRIFPVQGSAQAAELTASWLIPGGRIALSAGLTYLPLFLKWSELFSKSPAHFYPVDERKVPIRHPDSNWGSISRVLFNPWNDALSKKNHAVSAADYRLLLERDFGPGCPVFDVVFLGLGLDGHIASLFPGATDADGRPVFETESPTHPHRRITLGPDVLAAAKTLVLVVLDPVKQAILEKTLSWNPALPLTGIAKRRTETLCVIAENLLS